MAITRLAADDRDEEINALRALVTTLDQRLRVLEQEREAQRLADTTKPAPAPMARVSASDKEFAFVSADDANVLRLHGLVQADHRRFINDGGISGNDTFLIRRGRIILDGRFNQAVEFLVVPEFATSAFTLLDANVNLAWRKDFQIRAGRFKAPVGLEQLQSDPWSFFTERAFPSQLIPSRDLGVLVHGELAGGTMSYAVGLFNGVGDGGAAPTTDADDHKDIVARVFFQPFKGDKSSIWSGLGFGLGASTGTQTGSTGLTSGYRTDGQQSIFRYRTGVVADGRVVRVSPQAYWYRGPMGLLAEYAQSRADVRLTPINTTASLQHDAWQLAGSYVLTGEDASYRGVVPKANFDPASRTWGAWELTARVSRLELDAGAFPVFADPAASAGTTTALGLGVNWYPTRTLRATLNYFHNTFDLAPGAPATLTNPVLRQDEQSVITRLQVTF